MALIHGKQIKDTSVEVGKFQVSGYTGSTIFGSGIFLGMDESPTLGSHLANKNYVDSVATTDIPAYQQVWVDQEYGIDAEGEADNSALPFQTIQAAINAVVKKHSSGGPKFYLVHVHKGTYDERIVFTSGSGSNGSTLQMQYYNGAIHRNPNTADRQIPSQFSIVNAGSGLTDGAYTDVNLLGGTGTGQQANITVFGGVVTSLSIEGYHFGIGYTIGDTLTVDLPGSVQAQVEVTNFVDDKYLFNRIGGKQTYFVAKGYGQLINLNPNGNLDAESFSLPLYDGLYILQNLSGSEMFSGVQVEVKNIEFIINNNGYIYNRNNNIRFQNIRFIQHTPLTGAINAGNGSVIFRHCYNMDFAGPVNGNEGFSTNFVFSNSNFICDAEIALDCTRGIYTFDGGKYETTNASVNALVVRGRGSAPINFISPTSFIVPDTATYCMSSSVARALIMHANLFSNKDVNPYTAESIFVTITNVDPAGGDEFSIIMPGGFPGDIVTYTSLPGDTIADVLSALQAGVIAQSNVAGSNWQDFAGADPTWVSTTSTITTTTLTIFGSPNNRTVRRSSSAGGNYWSLVNNTGNSVMSGGRGAGTGYWIPYGPNNIIVSRAAPDAQLNQNFIFN